MHWIFRFREKYFFSTSLNFRFQLWTFPYDQWKFGFVLNARWMFKVIKKKHTPWMWSIEMYLIGAQLRGENNIWWIVIGCSNLFFFSSHFFFSNKIPLRHWHVHQFITQITETWYVGALVSLCVCVSKSRTLNFHEKYSTHLFFIISISTA